MTNRPPNDLSTLRCVVQSPYNGTHFKRALALYLVLHGLVKKCINQLFGICTSQHRTALFLYRSNEALVCSKLFGRRFVISNKYTFHLDVCNWSISYESKYTNAYQTNSNTNKCKTTMLHTNEVPFNTGFKRYSFISLKTISHLVSLR